MRTLRYSLRRVSPLDFVNSSTHNPKVGGSNPPPATNLFIGLQATDIFTEGAKRGIKAAPLRNAINKGCFGGFFHFAFLTSGRSTICTTLLLASRFDSIMASP